jgi:membrane fusion protein, multidrug efflux system
MKRLPAIFLACLGMLAITGCDEGHGNEQADSVVRPVLSMVVKPTNPPQSNFAGVIEPRYQTERAFQVLGRIIARNVDVGDLVGKGQTIAQIDSLSYELAFRTAEADLATAKSQLEKATAQRNRTRMLVEKEVSPQADLDIAQEAMATAAALVRQAEAQLAKAKEQLSYTTLTADIDGIVTSVDAEVGQMASPGMKVMTLARTDVREAVVDVPEDVARALEPGAPFEVSLQADPSATTSGKVREIAPKADATTRLRRIRITLDRPADSFRLGATITAMPAGAAGSSMIDIPTTAVFERNGETRVWVVDSAADTVYSVAVELVARNDRIARIGRGLESGTRVVIAGTNSLNEGQAVEPEEETVR